MRSLPWSKKRTRDRVVAELTFQHLIELGREAGVSISEETAIQFLNEGGEADEMWLRMMRAGEDYAMEKLRATTPPRPSPRAWALAHRQ